MKEILTTYQFTRGITKALQRVREGNTVVVTCENKEPVVIHKYSGDECVLASMPQCQLCDKASSHELDTESGTLYLCSFHLQQARNLNQPQ